MQPLEQLQRKYNSKLDPRRSKIDESGERHTGSTVRDTCEIGTFIDCAHQKFQTAFMNIAIPYHISYHTDSRPKNRWRRFVEMSYFMASHLYPFKGIHFHASFTNDKYPGV
ncbi:Hypothetical predicted protein [Octopus vulgaris]|uniref:Uncharacterized protein n=1 Tax=Octopus vulgaris TaxID=6645 RepID=A0AA36FKZ4_OCTVU|nr:Hypothetical predicted protein [Octopus vulgaris]